MLIHAIFFKVILVENKEESILRAEKRIKTLRLSNIMLYQVCMNIDLFLLQQLLSRQPRTSSLMTSFLNGMETV